MVGHIVRNKSPQTSKWYALTSYFSFVKTTKVHARGNCLILLGIMIEGLSNRLFLCLKRYRRVSQICHKQTKPCENTSMKVTVNQDESVSYGVKESKKHYSG